MKLAPLLLAVLLVGCTPIERTAYNTVVAAKGFTDSVKMSHPECTNSSGPSVVSTPVCVDLHRAIAAKDLIIDAAEIYCASSSFTSGGTCTPPAKGTASYNTALDKLNGAISGYNQTATDLRAVIK